MRNNVTALRHPTAIKQLRRALWLARLEVIKKKKMGLTFVKSTQYVANRKGNYYLRVDVYGDNTVTVWGDNSRDVTSTVFRAIIGA